MSVLTIGIPVYNEINHIKETIKNLFEVIAGSEDHIEIIVVDNGSSDGTREYLQQIIDSEKIVSFEVQFNPKNMGFNFSCDYLIKESRSDYLWIIGGQDKIYAEGISTALEMIRENPTLIVCNARVRDEGRDEIINESLWGAAQSNKFSNLNKFYLELGGPCQLISCNIFSAVQLKKLIHIDQITELWGFLERICDLTLDQEFDLKIFFTSKPFVEMLIESDGWQATGVNNFGVSPKEEFGSFFTTLELAELANSRFAERIEIKKSFPYYRDLFAIPRIFVMAKARGMPLSMDTLMRAIRVYRDIPLFWIIGIPILFFPKKLAQKALGLKRFVHLLRRLFKIGTF
jgi:glycosyltransferase involved in cell wall biosynthesis